MPYTQLGRLYCLYVCLCVYTSEHIDLRSKDLKLGIVAVVFISAGYSTGVQKIKVIGSSGVGISRKALS